MFIWNKGEEQDVLCENILSADLLGSQHLLEILQTSLTFKIREKLVKSGCFEKLLQWRAQSFFRDDVEI